MRCAGRTRTSASRLASSAALAIIISAGSQSPTAAAIALSVSKGAAPNQLLLTWSGGLAPYKLYRSHGVPVGGSEFLAVGSVTSYTLTIGDDAYFRIADSSTELATATITSPSNNSSTTLAAENVSGTVTSGISRVWVNKTAAQITGGSFSASSVPLVLGNNTLYATALTTDESVSVSSSQLLRTPGNTPTVIQITSPADSTDVSDVTPLFQVTFTDADGYLPTSFHAYLDGVEVLAGITLDPASGTPTSGTATWTVPSASSLVRGGHVLQVTVKDAAGFENSASSQFRITGPVLTSISPQIGLANSAVTLTGSGFGTISETHVYFASGTGTVAATINSITATQIQVTVPTSAKDGPVTVQVNGVDSNPVPFDVEFSTISGNSLLGIAIDAQDRVYFVDSLAQHVIRKNQDGSGTLTVFSTALEITGIGIAPGGTTLYISTRGSPSFIGTYYTYQTGRIWAVDVNTLMGSLVIEVPVTSYSDFGGIDADPDLPYLYVGVYRPDLYQAILAIDLSTGDYFPFVSFPLGSAVIRDVKYDRETGEYYTTYHAPNGWNLYNGSNAVYSSGDVGMISPDCVGRVRFTEDSNQRVLLLTGTNSASLIAASPFAFGIDLDSKGNMIVGSAAGVSRLTAPGTKVTACTSDFTVIISGDSSKILADFDPTTGDETPDSQFVVLTACTSVPTSLVNIVYWKVQDVDDPASDLTIDPNGSSGGDNRGTLSGTPFTQEGTYSLYTGYPAPFEWGTLLDASGCSKVRFHPTGFPGDNFTATALVRTEDIPTLIGSTSATSNVMTVWKRLHVEMDSVGVVTGPLDPMPGADYLDALIGDVPDPDASLLAVAFAPAYIEVDVPPFENHGEVAFDPHVPDVSGSPTVTLPQIKAQGTLGRTIGSASGSWWVYLQAVYEGGVDEDWDPDGENAILGTNYDLYGKWGLTFPESIRDFCGSYHVDEAYCGQLLVVHEIAHEFGIDDDETPHCSTNLMCAPWATGVYDPAHGVFLTLPDLVFTPNQLATIRCAGTTGQVPGTTRSCHLPGSQEPPP